MKDVIKTYNDPAALDKTTEVREKVDQLKGIMQDNVKRILETHVTLESLENSSSSMSSQANRFLRQSVDLRRQIQLRNLKIKARASPGVTGGVRHFQAWAQSEEETWLYGSKPGFKTRIYPAKRGQHVPPRGGAISYPCRRSGIFMGGFPGI